MVYIMSEKKIRLSIQEILADFELLIKYDERLNTLFDNNAATDEDIEEFHNNLEEMISKYLPNYKEKISPEYFSDDISTYEKSLMLYKPLYENFKEIFYQLV